MCIQKMLTLIINRTGGNCASLTAHALLGKMHNIAFKIARDKHHPNSKGY